MKMDLRRGDAIHGVGVVGVLLFFRTPVDRSASSVWTIEQSPIPVGDYSVDLSFLRGDAFSPLTIVGRGISVRIVGRSRSASPRDVLVGTSIRNSRLENQLEALVSIYEAFRAHGVSSASLSVSGSESGGLVHESPASGRLDLSAWRL